MSQLCEFIAWLLFLPLLVLNSYLIFCAVLWALGVLLERRSR
jgi:hypothetical protein